CFIGKLGGRGRGILPNQKVFFRVSLAPMITTPFIFGHCRQVLWKATVSLLYRSCEDVESGRRKDSLD
ncbi:hypothetical protein, partial [Pseudomonas aeruginosa]